MKRRQKETGNEKIEADCVRYGVQTCIRYDMPVQLRGFTTISGSGYLVMINGQLDEPTRQRAFLHELAHIKLGHLTKDIERDIMERQASRVAQRVIPGGVACHFMKPIRKTSPQSQHL